MAHEEHKSAFRALVHGMSWEGKSVNKKYRNGGRGVEEVLTAEVFQALEFLPRVPFASEVLNSVTRLNDRADFVDPGEVSSAEFLLSPFGSYCLRPSAPTHQLRLDVQFDALIRTNASAIFVEAKRIKASSFRPEQPARTLLIALRESGILLPKVLFVLGAPPPVKVESHGRLDLEEAVLAGLDTAYSKIEGLPFSIEEVKSRIGECIAWTTWRDIAVSTQRALSSFRSNDEHVAASVKRTAESLIESVAWHE